MEQCSVHEAAERLRAAEKIAFLCHKEPDGDTLGSASALAFSMMKSGKQVAVYSADPIPEKYGYFTKFLPNAAFTPDLVVSVDVADTKLLGSLAAQFEHIDLAIDHHASHRAFADSCLLDGSAIACAIVVYRLLKEMGVSFDLPILNALYTGLATDSGCFRYPATTPEAHRIAADLIEQGAEFAMINRLMFETKSVQRIRLERLCLENIKMLLGGKLAISMLSAEEMAATGATRSDYDGIAAIPREIEGVELGILARQMGEKEWKISTRSNENVDASAFCGLFGGGGHTRAAGCSLNGTCQEVWDILVSAAKSFPSLQ